MRKIRKIAALLAVLMCGFVNAQAQITITTVNGDPVCAGATLEVTFSSLGLDFNGVDTLQLRSPTGVVTNLATVAVAGPGTYSVSGTVPATFSGNYAVSVKSQSSLLGGFFEFADSVTVNPLPTPSISPLATCSGVAANLTLTSSTGAGSTFTWTTGAASGASGATAQATDATGPIVDVLVTNDNISPGTVVYNVTAKSAEGCVGSSTPISITVNPTPAITSTAPATPICSGGSINIPLSASATGTNTFTWVSTQTGVTGATTQSPTFAAGPINDVITTTDHTTAGSVSYQITPKSDQGCVGAATTFTVGVNPDPVMTTTTPPTPICSGETVTLTLTASTGAGATFTWVPTETGVTGATTQFPTFAAGPISSAITNPSTSAAGTLSYLVTPKSALGCVGAPTTYTVTVNPRPVVSTTPPTAVCSGVALNIPLSASTGAGATFTWVATLQPGITGAASQSPTFAAGPINDVLTNSSHTTAASVSYLVTPRSSQNCVGTSTTFTIPVNPAPAVTSAVPATPICSNTPLTIPLTASTVGTNTFTWVPTQTGVIGASTQTPTFAAGPINSVISTVDHVNAGQVSYLVTPKSSLGCVGAGTTFTVPVNPDPVVTNTPPATPICSGGQINILLSASTPNASTYTWTASQTSASGATSQPAFGLGLISNVITAASNAVVGSVSYLVVPKSALGCVGASTTFTVAINPAPVVSTSSPPATCSGVPFSLPLTASTGAGSTFTWIPSQSSVSGATTQLTFVSGPISNTLTTTTHTTPGSVDYLITPKSGAGCTGANTTLSVTVNPDPVMSIVNPPTSTCSGAPFTLSLSASTPGTDMYTWTSTSNGVTGASTQSTFVSTSISDVLTNSNPNIQGTVNYVVTPKSAAGCTALSSTTYPIAVNTQPHLNVTLDSVCSGTPFNKPFNSNASPTGSYTWQLFGGSSNLTITGGSPNGSGNGPGLVTIPNTFTYNSPTFGGADTLKYTVRVTNFGSVNNTCFSDDTFRIKVLPKPVVTNTPPTAVCSGTAISIPLESNVLDASNVTFNWSYNSAVGNVNYVGGQNPCIGCGTISQIVSATTTAQGQATYLVTATYRGCTSTPQTLIVPVNPRPRINGASAPASLCSGVSTNINLSANVPSTFAWTVDSILGSPSVIGNVTGNTISNTLTNLSNSAQAQVRYTVTPTALTTNCVGTDSSFFITINPKPTFTAIKFPICSRDSAIINLAAATSTGGNGTWQFAYAPAANAVGGASGNAGPNGSIRQRLFNNDSVNATFAVYSITPTSEFGCAGVAVNDTVIINPLPTFTSNRDTSICSDSVLVYNVRASTGASTQYAWLKVGNFGAPGNPSGFQFLNVPLSDSLNTGGVLGTRNVIYNVVLRSSNGCFSDTTVLTRPQLKVTINPTPDTVGVGVVPANICAGAEMLNFSSRRAPISPERFTWGASTGTAYHVSGENALISFPIDGNHTVFVTSNVPGFSCRSKPQPRTVTVGQSVARKPNVVRFDNSLVCLTGTTGGTITNYQWGYDRKSDLDSVLLPGETFQNYVFTSLDTVNRAYWVMATYAEGGCVYKAYFNRPPALGIGNSQSAAATLPMMVYPNPAHAQLNVELPRLSSRVQLEVIDLTGRKAMQTLYTSGNTTLNIGDLTPGCYFLNCYQDGQRVATARFIKN